MAPQRGPHRLLYPRENVPKKTSAIIIATVLTLGLIILVFGLWYIYEAYMKRVQRARELNLSQRQGQSQGQGQSNIIIIIITIIALVNSTPETPFTKTLPRLPFAYPRTPFSPPPKKKEGEKLHSQRSDKRHSQVLSISL